MHTRGWTPLWREQTHRARKGEVRIGRAEDCARRGGTIVTEQDCRRSRSRYRRLVLGVGEKCEIARLSMLDTRDPEDFHITVTLEATGKPLSKLT